MRHSPPPLRWGALAALAVLASAATAQTYSDSTFDLGAWTTTVFSTSGAGGSGSLSQSSTAGNSGAHGSVSITTASVSTGVASQAFLLSLRSGAVYDPSVSGAITNVASFQDGIMTSGFGLGHGIGLAARQGGLVYAAYFGDCFTPTWATFGDATLGAADFGRVGDYAGYDYVDFAQNPDFSAVGTTIEFGFWRICGSDDNNGPGFTIVTGIDNWSVSLTTQPVPEPASLGALGLGAAALLRRRKGVRA